MARFKAGHLAKSRYAAAQRLPMTLIIATITTIATTGTTTGMNTSTMSVSNAARGGNSGTANAAMPPCARLHIRPCEGRGRAAIWLENQCIFRRH